MRLKSMLVTLGILGSSSLALADHANDRSWLRDDRYRPARIVHEQPRLRDDVRYRFRDDLAYRQRTTWLALSAPERLERGGDIFDLRYQRERFAQLRLQNQTGRTLVRHIEIVFANGERQHVHVDRVLDGNYAMVNIQLDRGARRIAQVIVDGRSQRGSSYQLYAM